MLNSLLNIIIIHIIDRNSARHANKDEMGKAMDAHAAVKMVTRSLHASHIILMKDCYINGQYNVIP